MTNLRLLLSTLLLLGTFSAVATAMRRDCYNSRDVWIALGAALPGDHIVLHPGADYYGRFYTTIDGTESQPITIRSADSNSKAIMKGYSVFSYDAVLYITGNYWTVKDLKFSDGNKGIVYDNAIGGKVLNCEIYAIGEEAIHIRDGSSQFLIEGNTVYNTGLSVAGYGEGIYLGSDKGVHNYFDPTVSFVTVRNNKIGPNVRAEGIDVREGTHDILIENNLFDATGLSGQNSADSFIDLKGSHCIVRGNTFNQNGATNLKKGVNAIDRGVDKSSYDHVIIGNTFNLSEGTSLMVRANQNTQNIYVKDNVRSPSGSNYAGSIIQNRLPDWYTEGPNQVPATPNLPPTPWPTAIPTPLPTPLPTRPPTPWPTSMPTRLPSPSPTGAPLESCPGLDLAFVTEITSNSARVSWFTIATAVSYTVRYTVYSEGNNYVQQTGIIAFDRRLTSLQPSTMYTVEVQAVCAGGVGAPWTAVLIFVTQGSALLVTKAPTPAPTPVPPTPAHTPVDITKSYTIYANRRVTPDFWADSSSNGDFQVSYNDGGRHRSTYYALMQPGGKVRFESTGADLTGLTEMRFFVRSLAEGTGANLRLSVNNVAGTFTASKEWRDHVFNFSYWVSGAQVTSVEFENVNDISVTILFDDIRFLV